ncbi:hypothetical protein FACS189434_13260 [Bacteroidia bacterium]|nr:hypothetical protein FACS189434_13260 [Bacteroidia bacterium]
MKTKNVIILCEYSGRVRDAFESKGWNAWSCDLLPTESEQTKASGKHYQGDALSFLRTSKSKKKKMQLFQSIDFAKLPDKWDLLIAFPPCTYLSYAGNAHWNDKGRLRKRLEALNFFAEIWEAPVEHICIENPKGCASPTIAKYSQIIQPYYFGEKYMKTTCLWLKNLPNLTYSQNNTLFQEKTTVIPEFYYVNACSRHKAANKENVYKGSNNAKIRSLTFMGIANAMAEQWTEFFNNLQTK